MMDRAVLIVIATLAFTVIVVVASNEICICPSTLEKQDLIQKEI